VNLIEARTEGLSDPPWMEALTVFCERVLELRGKENWEISLLLCDAETMRGLNAQYRNIDAPTDVLSFSLGEEEGDMWVAGDIVIALPVVSENAKYFGVSEEEELKRLVIHGILHLEGFDHATNDVNEPMLVLQENILRQVKGECLF